MNIVKNQSKGNRCHNSTFHYYKPGLYLGISKGMLFAGRTVEQRNQKNGWKHHKKFDAVVNCIQKNCLRTGKNSHPDFYDGKDQAAIQ